LQGVCRAAEVTPATVALSTLLRVRQGRYHPFWNGVCLRGTPLHTADLLTQDCWFYCQTLSAGLSPGPSHRLQSGAAKNRQQSLS
jgi:hypothetical protein